jgi:hypothetical protein
MSLSKLSASSKCSATIAKASLEALTTKVEVVGGSLI